MKNDLRYFRNSLIKRFPHRPSAEIDLAIEQALEEMKPSRDRTRLNRRVVGILTRSNAAVG